MTETERELIMTLAELRQARYTIEIQKKQLKKLEHLLKYARQQRIGPKTDQNSPVSSIS